jgi:hypothetical protein
LGEVGKRVTGGTAGTDAARRSSGVRISSADVAPTGGYNRAGIRAAAGWDGHHWVRVDVGRRRMESEDKRRDLNHIRAARWEVGGFKHSYEWVERGACSRSCWSGQFAVSVWSYE